MPNVVLLSVVAPSKSVESTIRVINCQFKMYGQMTNVIKLF
jgi:hypothetical protein